MAYRNSLLVNYLRENPVWRDLIAIFEQVWGDTADELADQLSDIRNLYPVDIESQPKIDLELMLAGGDYRLFDRQTMVRICTMLGFSFPNLNDRLFSTEDYLRIAQNIAAYYKEQGTDAFIRFFGYCLNSRFQLRATWTNDYVTFVPEGDAGIGTPVWEGGDWYPTTHVQFEVDIGKGNMDPDQFRDFFYYIAPINLVLLNTVFKAVVTGNLYVACAARMKVRQLSIMPTLDKLRVSAHGRMKVRTLALPSKKPLSSI